MKNCLDHMRSKYDGAQFLDMKTLGKFFPPWTVSRVFWRAALQPDVSGVVTDVKLYHESGCRLVHRYRILQRFTETLCHMCPFGVIKVIAFVHRTMAITQLTHLYLTIPSSRTTTKPVPPDCFPIFPLTCKPDGPNKVSFAADVEVIGSPPNISSAGEELDFPDQSLPDNALHHDQDVVTIAPPTYVLFPFVDPSEDEEM